MNCASGIPAFESLTGLKKSWNILKDYSEKNKKCNKIKKEKK